MAKHKGGIKGSSKLKVKIVTLAITGGILVTVIGTGLFHGYKYWGWFQDKENAIVQKEDVATDAVQGNNGITSNPESNTGTNTNSGVNPFDPDLKEEESAAGTDNVGSDENNQTEEASPDYEELLYNLTIVAKEYCQNHKNSCQDIVITELNGARINNENKQVTLTGSFKNNTKFGNYIITLTNTDSELEIFKADTNMSANTFVDSLNSLLKDSKTQSEVETREGLIDFKTVNKYDLAANIVEGISDSSAADNLMSNDNYEKASYSLLLNSCVRDNSEFKYTYTVIAYTHDYIYKSTFEFTAPTQPGKTTLLNKIKAHLTNPNTTAVNSEFTKTNTNEKNLSTIKTNHNKESVINNETNVEIGG